MTARMNAAIVGGKDTVTWWEQSTLVEGLALMVIVKVPWEPELLDPWKAAWNRLIWKAMIPKVKAIEGELNRNPRSFKAGRSQNIHCAMVSVCHRKEVVRCPQVVSVYYRKEVVRRLQKDRHRERQ